MAKFHRAFGVYGIFIKQQQLVVVKKKDDHTNIAMIYLGEA